MRAGARSSTASRASGASTPAMARSIVEAAASASCASCPMRPAISASARSRRSGLPPELAERAPGDLNHVYFTLGGSDAVDSTVRFIRYYWNARGKPEKDQFISVEQGYHGSSTVGRGPDRPAGLSRRLRRALRLAAQDPVALRLSQPGRAPTAGDHRRLARGAARQGRGARRRSASPPSMPSRSRARAACWCRRRAG